MQILQRCRNLLIINNAVTQSERLGIAAAQFASFHSTNAVFEKWKNKFANGVRTDQESLKAYIKYTVRQKRADTNKALKDILCNGDYSTSRNEIATGYADQLNKKSRIKPVHRSKRASHKKSKRNHRRENPFDGHDDDPAKTFFASFGKDSSWNFSHTEQRSEWTKNSYWSHSRFNDQDAESGTESHSFSIGTYADRRSLGLPATGPLNIEDVKAAFRSSALKWHPDRHEASSRAAAEEKFKPCVDAYKSLCRSLSSRPV
ncbi:uncharacterized protein LOC121765902 [Salvia splendens]|uniref:uncharacterized protein LOC121765902 n=1 Tax=Salvia splendens TaxID=180675 RepID=UPI001C2772BE|nr:uncharacterized protein LOC121765902 [Salvia splendens]